MNVPVPSHHGQATVDGDPPRFEMTCPVPRQAEHGVGSGTSEFSSLLAMGSARLPPRRPGRRSAAMEQCAAPASS
jgi:hypothetical protein